ncbi:MAG: hypothetical protein KGO48_19115 [Alphaproteobacteria bacterium]|nr:hypothetical protein [Alphaproteobacteria bacterium]
MYTRRSASVASVAALAGLCLVANAGIAEARGEKHPSIRKALEALRTARFDLEHADHDFGGHRREAMESIDRAMEQLQVALRFDVR